MAPYALHYEASTRVCAPLQEVFDGLDDPMHLAAHMQRRSPMMAGAAMQVQTDAGRGRVLGSHIRMQARVLGLALELDEVVSQREPPWGKQWHTVGVPRLLVIGHYCMGFALQEQAPYTLVRIWIDYDLPHQAPWRWCARWLGPWYARWCVQQMLRQVQGQAVTTQG